MTLDTGALKVMSTKHSIVTKSSTVRRWIGRYGWEFGVNVFNGGTRV